MGPGGTAPDGAARAARRREAGTAAALFALVLAAYLANGDVLPGNDARPNVELPRNLLEHGRLSFAPHDWPDMFGWRLDGGETVTFEHWDEVVAGRPAREWRDAGRLRVDGARYYLSAAERADPRTGEPLYVGSYGIGSGLTALPVFAAASLLPGGLDEPRRRWYLGKLVAAACAAGAVLLAYLIGRRWLPAAQSLLLAAALAFGTGVWSSSSQTLWQHAPTELFLLLGLWAYLQRERGPAMAALAGAALAWAVACRPTSAVAAVVVGACILATGRRHLPAFALGALPPSLGLLAYNAWYLGSPLAFGQLASGALVAVRATGAPELWSTPWWLGAAGQLFSPARGLFVYSPFLLFAAWGVVRAWRDPRFAGLRPITLIALVLLCADLKWFSWWGGWSYGYRLKVDAAAILVLCLIPVLPAIAARPPARLLFGLLLAWSVAVQFLGAFAYDVEGWNNRTVGYFVQVPGRGRPVAVGSAEALQLAQAGRARVLGPVRGDVDDPAFRHRLWSLTDTPIAYYALEFGDARRRKRELMRRMWQRDDRAD